MQKRQELENDIILANAIGELIQAYEQIYINKMQQIRYKVLGTRYYMEGLLDIFRQLRISYEAKILKLKKSAQDLSVIKKNDKKVAVLFSASRKLSGEINQKVYRQFIHYLKKNPDADIVIVGETGRSLYQHSDTKQKYTYFEIGEGKLELKTIKPIIDFLVPYKQVQLFYGKFLSFINQQGTRVSIRGDQSISNIKEDIKVLPPDYLFEPTLEDILGFFETQIFGTLVKQTAHESYLAQIGSRVQALEIATDKIEEFLYKTQHQRHQLMKRLHNKKQLQQLSSFNLWQIR